MEELETFTDTKNNDHRFSLEKNEKSYLENNKHVAERGQWGGRFEFLLAIIGYTVGTGSIWRFPIICAKNGGGAFLIPFLFFLITCGGPLYYLEVCLGQFSGKSAVLAFELCPLFKGLGFLMVMISFLVTWYILVVLMWTLYFLFNSFFPVLPWTTCDNWWNTVRCTVSTESVTANSSLGWNYTRVDNSSQQDFGVISTTLSSSINNADTSPAYEFWKYNVLRKSSGLEEMGGVQLHLIICLVLAWTIIVLAVLRGVKTLGKFQELRWQFIVTVLLGLMKERDYMNHVNNFGADNAKKGEQACTFQKVVYVTATAPYIFLTIMFIRGLTLDGAVDGIVYYVTPDFEKLLHHEVWLEAAVQVFYSLGPTWGGVITMASYNKFHKKSFWDTAFCCGTDIFTAFYSGLVVFTIIGFMAKESGSSVDELARVSGPGLVFIAYPTALGRMPLPQLWAVLFFLMMVTVALDTDFGMFETVTSAFIDVFPKQLTKRRTYVNIGTGAFMFLIGIPFTCRGGIYLFQLIDWYSSAFALLLGSALEGIVVCWIYGADRFSKDISMMTGREVTVFLRVLWVLVIPVVMVVSFFLLVSGYSQPDYGDGYKYEDYAIIIGILIGLLPIFALIGGAIWQILSVEGNIIQRIKVLLRPSKEWGPSESVQKEIYHLQKYTYQDTFTKRLLADVRGSKKTPWF